MDINAQYSLVPYDGGSLALANRLGAYAQHAPTRRPEASSPEVRPRFSQTTGHPAPPARDPSTYSMRRTVASPAAAVGLVVDIFV
jgi:hypothetical protein